MLTIHQIIITHFKNYELSTFKFKGNIIGICGLNGIGKTNLLDAIYYSCFTKSYFSSSDMLNIKSHKSGFRIEADLSLFNDAFKVVCIHKGQNKKELFVNENLIEKRSTHIGRFPAVMIAPDDIEIIIGSGEMRRKYLDIILCQLDKEYLQQLIIYNKLLQQRNSHLKNEADLKKPDDALLDILDAQLVYPGNYIFEKRKNFTLGLLPLINQLYNEIAAKSEQIQLTYESHLLDNAIENLLHKNRSRDRILQRTQHGIHKDDIKFLLGNQIFKLTASQGQRKSLLFALKLAEFESIKKQKGFAPLLLLDDLFEKLDNKRMSNLLKWVSKENNGQIFITDTDKDRLERVFSEIGINCNIIDLI
jgi:DNA replication and repair protein RecF